jgi:hypothetical protein
VYRLAEFTFFAAAVDAIKDRKNEENRGPEGNAKASVGGEGLTGDIINKFGFVIVQNLLIPHLLVKLFQSQGIRGKPTEILLYGVHRP